MSITSYGSEPQEQLSPRCVHVHTRSLSSLAFLYVVSPVGSIPRWPMVLLLVCDELKEVWPWKLWWEEQNKSPCSQKTSGQFTRQTLWWRKYSEAESENDSYFDRCHPESSSSSCMGVKKSFTHMCKCRGISEHLHAHAISWTCGDGSSTMQIQVFSSHETLEWGKKWDGLSVTLRMVWLLETDCWSPGILSRSSRDNTV